MKYTITINQVGIVKAGLHTETDFADWAIIEYIKDWFFSKAKKVIYEEGTRDEYVWINYRHLLESMPMLNIKTKDGLSDRFKKLKKLELIKTIRFQDNNLFCKLTELAVNVCYSKEITEGDKQGVSESTTTPCRSPLRHPLSESTTTQLVYQSKSIINNNNNRGIPQKEKETETEFPHDTPQPVVCSSPPLTHTPQPEVEVTPEIRKALYEILDERRKKFREADNLRREKIAAENRLEHNARLKALRDSKLH